MMHSVRGSIFGMGLTPYLILLCSFLAAIYASELNKSTAVARKRKECLEKKTIQDQIERKNQSLTKIKMTNLLKNSD